MQPLMRWQSVVLVVVSGALVALLAMMAMGGGEELAVLGAGAGAPRALPSKSRAAGPAAGRAAAAGSRLVTGASTRYSDTYRRADGSMLTRVSSSPVNFRDAHGRWRAIDPTLVAAGGGFVNRGGAQQVSLPRQLADGVRVSSGRERLSMRLLGADGVAEVRGARARYRDVLPGVSTVYDSQPSRLREQLVLTGRRAPARLRFSVTATAGLRTRQTRRGDVIFSRAGRTVFVLPASFAYPQGRQTDTHPLRSALRPTPTGWTLTVAANHGWVHRALAHGPVVIDPTVDIDPPSADCRIENTTFADSSYCSESLLEVGSEPGGFVDRSLIRFDVASVLPTDAVVLNADLGLYLGSPPAHSQQVSIHPLSHSFTSSVSWNKYDATNAWSTAGGDFGAAVATATAPATAGWVDWYPTKLVQQWVNGSAPNNGLMVKATSETTLDDDRFSSSDAGSSTSPELDIVWSPRTGRLGSYTFDSQRLTDRLGLGVNVANGNLLLSNADLHVTGTGLDLDLVHYHNSLAATGSGIQGVGIGGTASLGKDVHLQIFADSTVAYYKGDGVALPFFDRTVSGTTASFNTAPPDLNAALTQDTSTGVYTLTFNRTEIREIFNSAGQLTAIKDRNDNAIGLTYYSTSGQGVDDITDTQGRVFGFDANGSDGDIAAVHDPTGRDLTFTYGSTGSDYLTDYTDAAGNDTLYAYDTSHRLNQITTPEGNVTKITYDGTTQRVASVKRTTDTAHTTGPTTTYAYSTGSPCTTAQKKTVVTDPNSHATTYCSDAVTDRVAMVKDALGNQRAPDYTVNGDTSRVIDTPGGTGTAGTATLTYDLSGSAPTYNLTNIAEPEHENTRIAYYNTGDAGGGGAMARFHPKQITDPEGANRFYSYSSTGNVATIKDAATSPHLQMAFTYNSDGTLHTSQDGNLNLTSFGYDAHGNLTSITPPAATVPNAPLAATTITVDGLSRGHTVTTGPSGPTQTLTYDELDHVTRVDVSDGSYFTYSYDDDGNLTGRSDYWGNTTSYTVDPLGRRTHEGFPGSKSNDYTYDAAGNLKTIVDGAGTVTYSYDAINRLLSIVSPTASGSSTDTVSYSYDDVNRTQTMTLPGATTETTVWDMSGKPKTITIKNSAGTVLRSLAYNYQWWIGEGGGSYGHNIQSVTDQSGARTTYSYSDTGFAASQPYAGRLRDASTSAAGSLVEKFHYTYDNVGNRVQKTDQTPSGTTTTSYGYNADNQLCWTYNGTAASSACNAPPAGATPYSYDSNGHGNETTAGATTYGYDSLDRATTLAGTTAGYLTPGNGELVSFGTTAFQNNLLGLSRQVAPSVTTSYVRDTSGAPVNQRTAAGKQFFLSDALGSTIALTDTSGSIVRSYSYDPDGNATTTGTGSTTDLRFTGGHQLGGLYHFGARYYDPGVGRWTQQDPLSSFGDLASSDRYAYASNDPVNLVDPAGTTSRRAKFEYCVAANLAERGVDAGCIGSCTECAVGVVLRGTVKALLSPPCVLCAVCIYASDVTIREVISIAHHCWAWSKTGEIGSKSCII